jgi:single-stranded DNA-binding protein
MKHWFKVDMCGVLADKPQVKSLTPEGLTRMAQFTVCRDRGGGRDFARVTAWGQMARDCVEFLRKGDTVQIRGDCRSSTYTKDGIKTHGYEIVLVDYATGDDIALQTEVQK